MKFFDPKKKENHVGSATPSTPQPSEPARPPLPPPPAQPVSSTPVREQPVPAVPTISMPIPQPKAAPEAKPVLEQKPEVKPVAAAVTSPRMSQTILGASLMIKGTVTADENIIVDGAVDGTIETTRDVIVGPQGNVRAGIRAANVIISGRVIGDVTATSKVDLAGSGVLQGNIRAPRLSVAESSLFRGRIDMTPSESSSSTEKEKPVETPESEKASLA